MKIPASIGSKPWGSKYYIVCNGKILKKIKKQLVLEKKTIILIFTMPSVLNFGPPWLRSPRSWDLLLFKSKSTYPH
jgi:hypothetical protein